MSFLALTGLLNFFSSTGLGILVFRKCPDRRLAVSYGLVNLAIAVFSLFYFFWQMSTSMGAAYFNMQGLTCGAIWINQAFLAFIFVYLGGTPFQRRVLWIAFGLNVIFSICNYTGVLYLSVEPRFGQGYWPSIRFPFVLYLIFWHAELLYAFSAMVQRFRTTVGPMRNQMKYMLVAFAIGYLGGISNWFMWFRIHIVPYYNVSISVYCAIMGYAMIKHHLMDINVIVRRTVIYSLVTAILTAIYLSLILFMAHVSESYWAAHNVWVAIVAAVITTLIFHPLREKIQHGVDARFFRSRIQRQEKLAEFSNELIQQGTPDKATASLLRVLNEAIHPKIQALYLRAAGEAQYLRVNPESRAAASLPLENPWGSYFSVHPQPVLWGRSTPRLSDTTSEAWVRAAVPLVTRGEVLGFLLLGEKTSEQPYSNEDLILLRIVVNQATAAYERPRLIREVSGGFVHEIKTPLANIALPAELCFMELQEVERGEKAFADILPRLKRRLKFIMDQAFLDGHRIEAVQQLHEETSTDNEPLVIGGVVRKSASTLLDLLNTLHIGLELNLPESLPPVQGNARQLEVVFVNLIKNAAEAMRDQARPRRIEIAGTVENGALVIRINDNGPGFTPESRDLVFESHFTTKGAAGAGMGLHLTRQVVRAHGGHITLEPPVGAGARFRIELPVKD